MRATKHSTNLMKTPSLTNAKIMHNIQFEKILVEKLIKQSSLEKTHIVYLSLTDGSRIGPFIRKIITKESGLGKTYKLLFDSQNNDFSNLHVPNIYYYKEGKDAIEIIEENIDGVNLAQFCEKHITENEAIKIAISLSDAVTYLHENFSPSIIHRDIKPENIVISRKNSNGEAELSATLIDFGIARAFDEKADNDTRAFGTRGYAPPEQFGFAQTNERSDIYSLGKVIEFLFGKVEQKGSSVSSDQAPNNSDFVKLTNVIVNKACAFDPKDRFSSAKEITQILNAYLDGQKIDVVELHNSTTNNTKSILGILYNAAVIFCFV